MKRGFGWLALFVLGVLFVAGCDAGAERHNGDPAPQAAEPSATESSAGCGSEAERGASVRSVESDGLQRTYRLYVPTGYDPVGAAPLVLNFHGFGSNGVSQEAYSGLAEVAEREGFLLVSPDGAGSPPQWHIYGRLLAGYVDDFAFTERLLDQLSRTLCVDESRVYAAGLSNGGGMAQLLGCRLNERFAAVASVAGAPFSDDACEGKDPVPVVAFHGTADEVVAFNGEGSILGLPFPPIRTTMANWAEHNGCDGAPKSERIAEDVTLESYAGCDEGADVELYVIEGGGHTWPGALDRPGLGRITQSISASELLWEFFETKSR